ncbi:MAG: polysulfide reductase NrfD [Anaerolineales bacterium]|nr:polysulfide reductase NrfD [Anaerolineales bacterium]
MATGEMTMKPVNNKLPLRLWYLLLAVMLGSGIVGAVQVFWQGLTVTNLTDRVPWGLWITHDLSAIGLGAGAFTFSAVVYLFRIKRFEPIARAAVFVGFLGYTSAMLALALDIGRPDRFWHPLVYWNVHSVLWEITLCVIFYSTVLVIEFLPIIFESRFFDNKPKWRIFGHKLHALTPVMAVVGLGLSMLHQSSLGATYGVLSGREIWFKPSMPVLFILSAIAGGVSLTLLVTMIVWKLTGREVIDKFLRRDIARLAAGALLAYLYLKFWDWAATSYYSHAPGTANALARLQATTPYTRSFWIIEVLLGGLVPAIILLNQPLRRRHGVFMTGLALVVVGVIVNRWNVTLSGLIVPPEWSPGVLGNVIAAAYLPSWTEVAVSLGILGYALLGFTLGVRYLPLYPKAGQSGKEGD